MRVAATEKARLPTVESLTEAVMLILVLVLVLACPVLEKSLLDHLTLKVLSCLHVTVALTLIQFTDDQMLETLVFLKCNRHM